MSSVRVPCDADGRVRVRSRVAVVSAVSCANVVCEKLAERSPELAVLTHQHGCGQLGADLDLTRELLAALAAHPNVAAALFVSLGCETNAPDALVAAARRRGGTVDVVGIQASGGVDAAVARAEARVQAVHERELRQADVPAERITIGLVADAGTLERRPEIHAEVGAALRGDGFRVLEAAHVDLPRRARDGGPLSVTARWKTGTRSAPQPLSLLLDPDDSQPAAVQLAGGEVERMTVLTALGAQAIVALAGRPNLTGAAIAPTVKVSTDPGLDVLTDVFDVPYSRGSLPERVVAAVRSTLAGGRTRAEELGMRDLALPRLAPNY